jgi:hypothetical protein
LDGVEVVKGDDELCDRRSISFRVVIDAFEDLHTGTSHLESKFFAVVVDILARAG